MAIEQFHMLENHYCDTASFFVAALRHRYRTAVLTGLGTALSCGAKIPFPLCGSPGFSGWLHAEVYIYVWHICMALLWKRAGVVTST